MHLAGRREAIYWPPEFIVASVLDCIDPPIYGIAANMTSPKKEIVFSDIEIWCTYKMSKLVGNRVDCYYKNGFRPKRVAKLVVTNALSEEILYAVLCNVNALIVAFLSIGTWQCRLRQA